MKGESLAATTRYLVFVLSALYGLAAIIGLFALDFASTRNVVFWLAFLLGGACLMLVGQLLMPEGWGRAFLVSVGAAAGGFPLVVTLIVPVAVAVVVAGSIALARRAPAHA